MATVTKTLVSTSVSAPVAEFVGDFTIETVTNMLIGAYPFLANSVASEKIDTDENGLTTRTISFSERTATKGA